MYNPFQFSRQLASFLVLSLMGLAAFCEVYINGIPAVSAKAVPPSTDRCFSLPIEDRTALRPGDNVPGQEPRVRVEERCIDAVGDSLLVGPASAAIYSLDAAASR